ncbi:hypothetical protein [Endozoicomonas sp. SESOKO1]|uniref:hypothetical protein n=1 Tax=Endozoicomonas sp. SESOKO1 TaxID=2828742 RepID=UPI002147950C|nr:hypothetical protein [Endozoicomonas sp. SESOKO1]
MANPIGGSGTPQSGSSVTPSAGGVSSASPVSSGFSSGNSQSYASASVQQAGAGLLPGPASGGVRSEEYLQQAKLARLQAIMKTLESLLASDADDLSSTQTIMMVMRGKVNDMRVLMNTVIIEGVLGDYEALYDQKMKVPELRYSIWEKQGAVDNLKSEQAQKQKLVNDSNSRLNTIQSLNAFGLFSSEISSLQALIANVQSEINTLSNKVSSQEAEVAQLNNALQGLQLSGLMARELDAFMDMLSIRLVRSPDKASLESGEEKVDQLKRELKEINGLLNHEGLKLLMEKQQTLQAINERINREYRLAGHSVLSAMTLPSFTKEDSRLSVEESGMDALTEQSVADVSREQLNHVAQGILAAYHGADQVDISESVSEGESTDIGSVDINAGGDSPADIDNHSVDIGANNQSPLPSVVSQGLKEPELDNGLDRHTAAVDNNLVSSLPGIEALSLDIAMQQEQIDQMVSEFLEDEQRSQESIRNSRTV